MPDIAYGTSLKSTTGGTKPQRQRRPRSNILPPPAPHVTDPVISNLESLVDVAFKPIYTEIYTRGQGDYAAFALDFLNVQLHPGQIKWLHAYPWCNERHLSSGNRFGKSYSAAIKALHDAFYQTRETQYASLTNDYIVLNLSLTIDMARIVFDYAMRLALDSKMFSRFVLQNEIKTAPFPLMPLGTPKSDRNNAFRSEIWARSSAKDARYLLGRKFDLVNYDECARDPHGDKILDEVLRMRLADRNGRIDMTSTAAGRNWFYMAYLRGLNDRAHDQYFSMTGTSFDNPYINHDRVRANESVMSDAWKEQNIYGGFADYANVFERAKIELCYAGIEYALCTDYTQLDTARVDPEKTYLMAIDWAIKRDETVILVADVSETPAPIVFAQGFSFKPNGARFTWNELKTAAVLIHKRFNEARCFFDSTGMAGEMIAQDLTAIGMKHHDGYNFAGDQGQGKDHLILVTQQALQNRAFQFPFTPITAKLVDQLLLYDRKDKNLATDWVFSFALLSENLRHANLPISESLDAPFVFASRAYEFTGYNYSPEAYRIRGFPGAEQIAVSDALNDKFKPESEDMVRALTSMGYKDIPKQEAVN